MREARCSDSPSEILEVMVRSVGLEMLQDVIFHMIKILVANRDVLMGSDRSVRVVLLFAETKADERLAVGRIAT